MAVMVYALYTYHWRAASIRKGGRGPYDDRVGPVSCYHTVFGSGVAYPVTQTILCIALLGLSLQFIVSIAVLKAMIYSRYRCQLHFAFRPGRLATLNCSDRSAGERARVPLRHVIYIPQPRRQ